MMKVENDTSPMPHGMSAPWCNVERVTTVATYIDEGSYPAPEPINAVDKLEREEVEPPWRRKHKSRCKMSPEQGTHKSLSLL